MMTKIYPCAILLIFCCIACNNKAKINNKLQGNWRSEDSKTALKITDKEFILNEGEEPIAENYFIKGDTIFTSYEGTEPYTKFAVKNLAENSFTLVYPDSTLIRFKR